MKKNFIVLFFLSFAFIPLSGFGQISSGTILLGGGFGYSNHNVHASASDYKNWGFSISPSSGIFISNNLAVGLGVGFNTHKQSAGSNANKTFGYALGPFVRYYKFLGEKTAVFGNAGFDYAATKNKHANPANNSSYSYSSSSIGAAFTPGLTYFATPKFGLELSMGSLGFNKNVSESTPEPGSTTETKSTGFGVNFGLSNLALGIRFYLNRG